MLCCECVARRGRRLRDRERQAGQRKEERRSLSESESDRQGHRPCFDREIEISQSIRIELRPTPSGPLALHAVNREPGVRWHAMR